MKCLLCQQETGGEKKRFCGHYSVKGTCAYKNNAINSAASKRSQNIKQPKKKESGYFDYCEGAKSSGYF